jgi:hypothetical protein
VDPASAETPQRRLPPLACGGAALVFGAWLRYVVLRSAEGSLNADEATMAIAALDIRRGALPVVLEGQAYTAVLESYPATILISLLGPGPNLLKMIAIVLWAAASLLLVGAARQVTVSRSLSWTAGALCWIAPGAMLIISTRAYPGYSIGLAAVAGSLWATGRLLNLAQPARWASAVAGAAAGLAFYIHPMFLSVIVPHIAVAAWQFRRELRSWWIPAVAGAVLVNGPFLVWSIANGLEAFDNDTAQPGSYLDRIIGFATSLMPRALGLMRSDGTWVLGQAAGVVIYLVVIVIAAVGVVRLARGSDAQRAMAISAVFVWPLMALFAAHGYVLDGRYGIIPLAPGLVCLVCGVEELCAIRLGRQAAIGEPKGEERVIVEAAALASERQRLQAQSTARFAGLGLIVGWIGLLLMPYLSRALGPAVDDPNPTTNALVTRLREAGVTRVAGSYWLVEPVAVWTQGEISVKPTYPQPIRSQRMADIVDGSAADTVAHVFYPDQDWTWTLNMPPENYLREEVGGVLVYLPIDQK